MRVLATDVAREAFGEEVEARWVRKVGQRSVLRPAGEYDSVTRLSASLQDAQILDLRRA